VTVSARRIVWQPAARDDVRRILDHLLPLNPQAAFATADGLEKAADRLGEMPLRGRPGRLPGTRELLASAPYVLVYDVTEDEVRILRIWHAAQDRR
jgi:plasmid stabilization system protein ParE